MIGAVAVAVAMRTPLAVEQGRLEERQVAVPVNDTALGDDPPGSHRAQEVHVELERRLKLVGLERGQQGWTNRVVGAGTTPRGGAARCRPRRRPCRRSPRDVPPRPSPYHRCRRCILEELSPAHWHPPCAAKQIRRLLEIRGRAILLGVQAVCRGSEWLIPVPRRGPRLALATTQVRVVADHRPADQPDSSGGIFPY
jgi:hypothetical protein